MLENWKELDNRTLEKSEGIVKLEHPTPEYFQRKFSDPEKPSMEVKSRVPHDSKTTRTKKIGWESAEKFNFEFFPQDFFMEHSQNTVCFYHD